MLLDFNSLLILLSLLYFDYYFYHTRLSFTVE